MVTGVNSGGLLHGSIGTCIGLGQTEGANPLTRSEFGQILHLLLLGAVFHDGSDAQRGVSREDNTRGGTHAGEFLNSHDIHLHGTAGTAILLGDRNTHHAEFAHLLDSLDGETLLLIHFGSKRLHLVLCKRANHLQEQLFSLRITKIHILFLSF